MTDVSSIFQIVLDILGVGGIVTSIILIIDKIRFRKQEKKIKDSETEEAAESAEQKKLENDKEHLELTERYRRKVIELEDERSKLFIPIRDSIFEMKHDLKETKQDTKDTMDKVSSLEEKYSLMEGYMNGEFQNYIKKMKKKKPIPMRKTRKKTDEKDESIND